jgi:aldehyde dehydrogenase (NAD+)
MRIAREEIFGPVLVIIPYENEEEAIQIANDSPFGLAGGVWTADRDHGLKVARRMRTGMLTVNGAQSGFMPLLADSKPVDSDVNSEALL